jgi:hypothetical protein
MNMDASFSKAPVRTRRLSVYLALLWTFFVALGAAGAEPWQAALEQMPLGTNVTELNLTNCVAVMLPALQSNQTVKALIFMPGATDEFYFFHRAKAALTNASPTLLDAVNALAQQTRIRVTFRPPMLLLHTAEDPLEPLTIIKSRPTAERLRQTHFLPHVVYNDRDWDFLLPILTEGLKMELRPGLDSMDSWHFYRHSFAAWDLTGWETLQAIALAGKTTFTVRRDQVVFEGDKRKP